MSEHKIDTTKAVRPGEELNLAALQTYLNGHVPKVGRILEISQFPGGFSNLTYCLKTAEKEYVLRRPPFGANIKGGHDMGREFRVLSLLQDHYTKIPQPLIFCEDEGVLDAPFYIMERIRGVILRPANAPSMHLSPEVLRQTSAALVDNLVELHALDIETTGLVQLGKPEGYVQRQVEGWIKRYYHAETDKIEQMDAVADWLTRNQPQSQSPTLLHNDYKYDNVILNPEDFPRILGVLDWEMATVGDPLMDLGATLAYWVEATDDKTLWQFNITWLPGNLSRQEVIERYAAKSGRDLSKILFYYVFGMFKNAVIVQQIYARWKKGHTQDERFGKLLPVILDLAKRAVKALETNRVF